MLIQFDIYMRMLDNLACDCKFRKLSLGIGGSEPSPYISGVPGDLACSGLIGIPKVMLFAWTAMFDALWLSPLKKDSYVVACREIRVVSPPSAWFTSS